MQHSQQNALPITDRSIIRIALKKAGGYSELEDKTSIARSTCWRLLSGKHDKLQDGTRTKLIEFINEE